MSILNSDVTIKSFELVANIEVDGEERKVSLMTVSADLAEMVIGNKIKDDQSFSKKSKFQERMEQMMKDRNQ